MVQQLHTADVAWDACACAAAADSGHLNVIQWARMNGCLWNKTTCLSICSRNDVRACVDTAARGTRSRVW